MSYALVIWGYFAIFALGWNLSSLASLRQHNRQLRKIRRALDELLEAWRQAESERAPKKRSPR